MKAREVARSLGVIVTALAFGACQKPPPPAVALPSPVAQPAPPAVLDAFGARDATWVYADGRSLRQAGLPELLQAASALRADVQVALAAAAAQCGYQPLLSIDELLVRVRWDAGGKLASWAAVFRANMPPEQTLRCLTLAVPEARETSLDGRRAWQLPGGLIVLDRGLFIVSNSAVEIQATEARLARPEQAAFGARSALSGVMLTANVAGPNPFGMDALAVRWVPRPSGSRLDFNARFPGDTSARQAEGIFRDALLQMTGSNASFDPSANAVAERFVKGAAVKREGTTVEAAFEMPPLAGQAALVSRLTSLVARGVRQQAAWDLSGEARETVFTIARALVEYATRSRSPGHPARFPPSAPLVPDDIPYGKRVIPNAHSYSHPSWQDIRYSSDKPTFYAYDFVTAKDGRSAVVRARGDIDGDGTTSLFELDLRLDARGTPTIAPVMRERDPEE